jgi:hypothetical protein
MGAGIWFRCGACSGPLQSEALLASDLRWDRSRRYAALGAEDHVDHQSCSR